MYKLVKNNLNNQITAVHRLSDNAFIPMSEGNTDYQAYLVWLDEGNEPLPVDKPQVQSIEDKG